MEVGGDSCLSLASEKGGCNLEANAKAIENSPAETRVAEIRERWMELLPDDPDALWDWLLKQEQAVVLELLAFCVGQTVHAVRLAHDSCRLVAADKLAKAIDLSETGKGG